MHYLGSVRFIFERTVQSKYSDVTSTMTCSSRSQCFSMEEKDAIDREYGTVPNHPPMQYDPILWGWELTGLSVGMYL